MLRLGELRPAVLQVAPTVSAALTLACGAMLLVSGATPSDPARFAWLMSWAPLVLIELSHFLSSVLGLALVLTAFGLNRRLDAAWAATLIVSFAAALLAFFKGVDWEETVILLALGGVLLPLREAFPRTARLSRMEIAPGWLISAFLVLVGAGLLGWWLFHNLDYGDQQFFKIMRDDPSRAIRATVGAGVLLLVLGIWRLFATPATPKIAGDHDPDFDHVRQILQAAEGCAPDAGLALLGDKRFLFSQSGRSFLMFGVRGRSWIAMGAPVGLKAEAHELLWRFRELADAHAARPGFYGLGPEHLPEMVEMGFAIQKAGEAAVVPLESFSLQGRKREVLRRNWRKASESGAAFEVIGPAETRACMPELKRISDQWLARHAGGEKGFSMGGFVEHYVAEFPCALVRKEGRIVAFATLWTTPDRSEFSMDLMRYCDEAPKNVMDFLFVELFQWGLKDGYRAFDFGMAPLAGMLDRPLAPMLSRMGRLLFERGEDIYNFQGVRRYKDKFDPSWAPRYIAGPSKWSIPILLADVGLLSSGGVSGLTRRKAQPAASAAPLPQAA